MSAKAPQLLDVIICDDVRQEANGKLIIIGMYLDNIGVPSLPFSLSSLTFLVKWRIQESRLPAGKFRVVTPSGCALQELTVKVEVVPDDGSGLILTPLVVQPCQIAEAGMHRLLFQPEGGRFRSVASFEIHCRD